MGTRRYWNENLLIAVVAAVGIFAAVAVDYLADEEVVEVPLPEVAAGSPEEDEAPVADPFEFLAPEARSSLPLIELALSRKDVSHFEYLYSRLSDDQQYYRDHNSWRKAQLRYRGEQFEIRVRSHGRQPTGHQVGQFISMTIKMEPGALIEGMSRFKLIVRERLNQNNQLVMAMARDAGLIFQDHRLVSVRINNWPEKLFYLSNIIDDEHMEVVGESSFRAISSDDPVSNRSDKAFVYTNPDPSGSFEPTAFRRRFEFALAQREIPESEWEPLLLRFSELNAAIAGSSTEDPSEFFDLDYLRRFEVVRYVLGLLGHGFMGGNLRVLLNTANGKFYPALSRDNIPFVLDLTGKHTPEQQLSTWPDYGDGDARAIPLFHYLAKSDRIRQEVYRALYAFITEHGERVATAHREILDGFASLDTAGIAQLKAREGARTEDGNIVLPEDLSIYDGIFRNITALNIQSLREYLERSAPEFSAGVALEGLVLTVRPNSMSELRVESLRVGSTDRRSSLDVPVWIQITEFRAAKQVRTSQLERMARLADGSLDLSGSLADARFSTSVGSGEATDLKYQPSSLERTPRLYRLVFSFADLPARKLRPDVIRLSFVNTVTGDEVEARRVDAVGSGLARSTNYVTVEGPPADSVEVWLATRPELGLRQLRSGELLLPRGSYLVAKNLVFPKGYDVTVESGVDLRLGAGVVVLVNGGLTIKGTDASPVTVRPIDPAHPFGSVAVVGDGSQLTTIRYVELSGGSEGWVKGVHFSGGLSIHYQSRVRIAHSSIRDNHGDDGLNIKHASGLITESTFAGNRIDQVDLDYFEGLLRGSAFASGSTSDGNGDGIDISGSKVVAIDNEFVGFVDKGVSVGERSEVLLLRNRFSENLMAVAVKDLSTAYLLENWFDGNGHDVSAYMKKRFFGGGRVVFAGTSRRERSLSVELDRHSDFTRVSPRAVEGLLPPEIRPARVVELLTALSNLSESE